MEKKHTQKRKHYNKQRENISRRYWKQRNKNYKSTQEKKIQKSRNVKGEKMYARKKRLVRMIMVFFLKKKKDFLFSVYVV